MDNSFLAKKVEDFLSEAICNEYSYSDLKEKISGLQESLNGSTASLDFILESDLVKILLDLTLDAYKNNAVSKDFLKAVIDLYGYIAYY